MTKPLPDPERKSNLLIEAGAVLLAAIVATIMVLYLRAGSGPALNGPLPPPHAEMLVGLPPVTLQLLAFGLHQLLLLFAFICSKTYCLIPRNIGCSSNSLTRAHA